jgi:ABC-type sugar transport system permease subunit
MADGKSREFVKFDNYIEVLKIIFGKKDRGILNYHGVLNSLTLIPLSLIINLPLTVLFAYGIYKKLPLHNTFRIVLFLPAVISSVVLCLAFRLALDNSSGILIQLLRMIGLGGDGSQFDTGIIPVGGFLGNEDTMWGTILVFSVWTGVNGNLIYFSSSMARLPESVFESAELDGATQLRQFISICIPLIWPTITTMSITLVAGVFSWMMPSLLLTDGAPRATTIGLMVSQTVKNDKNNTVISAFGVLIAVFGGALIMSFRYLMEKVTEGVEY